MPSDRRKSCDACKMIPGEMTRDQVGMLSFACGMAFVILLEIIFQNLGG